MELVLLKKIESQTLLKLHQRGHCSVGLEPTKNSTLLMVGGEEVQENLWQGNEQAHEKVL